LNLSEYIGIQPKTKELLNALDIGMEAIGTDLNTILNDLLTLKGYTDTLEAGQTIIKGYTDTLESAIATIQGYVDTLESGQTSLDGLLDTCIAYLDRLEDHNHNNQLVYPTLADPPQLISGTGKWTLGNFIELIPANAIAYPFDLHYFNTGIGSLVGTYEVHLFSGTVGSEVNFAKLRFARLSNQTGASPFPIMTPVFPANTRISGKLAVNATTQETLLCSFAYHHY
jgi:hypothetical protein